MFKYILLRKIKLFEMGKFDEIGWWRYFFKGIKQTLILSAGILSLLFVSHCKNDSGSDPVTEPELEVKILGHKGGGTSSFNSLHIENTLPSVEDGLKVLDGIELDVQMSLDGTLWLYHDPDVSYTSCGSAWSGTIPLLTDNEIQNVLICDGSKQSRIYKLEEIVNYWNADAVGFFMSLHIKLDFSSEILYNLLTQLRHFNHLFCNIYISRMITT